MNNGDLLDFVIVIVVVFVVVVVDATFLFVVVTFDSPFSLLLLRRKTFEFGLTIIIQLMHVGAVPPSLFDTIFPVSDSSCHQRFNTKKMKVTFPFFAFHLFSY